MTATTATGLSGKTSDHASSTNPTSRRSGGPTADTTHGAPAEVSTQLSAGSVLPLVAAHNESRDAIGIDLDDRNVAMVEDRLGPLVAACDLTVLR